MNPRRAWRWFWPHLRREKTLLTGSSLALVAETGLGLLEPWPLKFVFDHLLHPKQTAQFQLPFLAHLEPTQVLAAAAFGIVAITGLRALASYSSTIGLALMANRVMNGLRFDLYRHLQRLSLDFHSRSRTGDLTMRFMGDIGQLKDVAVTAALPLVSDLLLLIGMVVVLFMLDWQLALATFAVFPLFVVLTRRAGMRIRDASRAQRKREGNMAATASEAITAIKVVQALSLEPVFERLFNSQNRKELKQGVQAKRLAAGLERSVDLLMAAATALVLWAGAQLVLSGQLTAGSLLVFLTYQKKAFGPIKNLAKFTNRLFKASAAAERVIDILELEPSVQDKPYAQVAHSFEGRVQFKYITFAYGEGQRVLEGFDLTIRAGERIALVGPSGQGKSTLASLLLRLYDPQYGSIEIDGHDLRDFTLESLRSQIGVVLQENLLFAASVADNISYGLAHASRGEIERAAKLANAHEFIEQLERGYDTVLSERGGSLSGGQRQRITIARAAIRQTPILLLDEPTTGLDEENQRLVSAALEELSKERTTLLITHDLELASRLDRVVYLENGCVLEQGHHAELMRSGGRYASFYRSQVLKRGKESVFDIQEVDYART
jgi:ATP-binding cassette, subfamily B, bacterial